MTRFATVLLASCIAAGAAHAQPSTVRLLTSSLDLGRVLSVDAADRTIRVENVGVAPVRILKVALTPPLRVVEMPRAIAPSTEADIAVRMDPSAPPGPYDGTIHLFLSDSDEPLVVSVGADVVRPIEFAPRPMFFVATVRGREASASIDIINNEAEPLRIDAPEQASERFTIGLRTIEDGRRFRLTLRMRGDAPAGRHAETIVLDTSSRTMPRIELRANTLLHERVHTFPDAVHLGTIPIGVLKRTPEAAERLAQTLMVYQADGRDFRVSFDTDVPGLSVRSARGPQRDRHQLTLMLDRDHLEVGPIRGTLFIATNDPQWPRIEVPVSGTIVP